LTKEVVYIYSFGIDIQKDFNPSRWWLVTVTFFWRENNEGTLYIVYSNCWYTMNSLTDSRKVSENIHFFFLHL